MSMDPDSVRAFLNYLRSRGFDIGVDDFVAVECMLVMLASHPEISRMEGVQDGTRMGAFIAPLVCRSASQQEVFAREFREWLQAHEAGEMAATRAAPHSAAPKRAGRGRWVATAASAVAAFGAVVHRRIWRGNTSDARSLARYSPLNDAHRLLRVSRAQIPELFRGVGFRRSMRRLSEASRGRDDADSVLQMVCEARWPGWRTPPVSSERPGLLVLIDQKSYRDEWADVAEEFAAAMIAQDIPVVHYRFFRDPRILYRVSPAREKALLWQVAQAYPRHSLILATDGSGLLDPAGYPSGWLTTLQRWDHRFLLVPPQWEAAGVGRIARRYGFTPASMDTGALAPLFEALARAAEGDERLDAIPRPPTSMASYPSLLSQSWHDWLLPTPPDAPTLDRLLVELETYLGAEALQVLAACAVYPRLAWPLTKYLAALVSGQRGDAPLDESRMGAIAVLPWFRGGVMPDYLRGRLIATLTAGTKERVREALLSLLGQAIAATDDQAVPLLELTNRDWVARLMRDQVDETLPAQDPRFRAFLRR